MQLVRCGSGWEIQGPQKERGRIASAVIDGSQLRYEVPGVGDEILTPPDQSI
jgi:hypothetical protein